MSSNLPYKQAANVERRTWDKEMYEARARARNEAVTAAESVEGVHVGPGEAVGSKRCIIDNGAIGTATDVAAAAMSDEREKEEFIPAAKGSAGPERSQRAYLKARRSKVDLESRLGTSEIINPDAVSNSGGVGSAEGGTVSITDGVTKSSTGVGWHCKVCDCYLKDSMTYLDHINGRKHQRYLGYSMRVEKSTKNEVTSKLSLLAEEKRKAEMVAAAEGDNPAAKGDDEGNAFEDAVRKRDEEALKRKAERARRKEERKKKEQEEREEEEAELSGSLDPAMAAMMGFSGFGSTKK
jgi:U4/U6.U5 tri-snRNP component SNU23